MSDLRSFSIYLDGHLKPPKLAPTALTACAMALEQLPENEALRIKGHAMGGYARVTTRTGRVIEARLMTVEVSNA